MSEGILERIEAKQDEILALLKAGGGKAAATGKAAASNKDKAADKPSFTAEQLRDKFLEVQGKHGDVVTKALIAEAGFDKLAKLVADTATWQKSWDLAEAKLAEDVPEEDGGL